EELALETDGREGIEPRAGLDSAAALRLVVHVFVAEEHPGAGLADDARVVGVRARGDQGRHVGAALPPLQVIGLHPNARRSNAKQRPARSPAGFRADTVAAAAGAVVTRIAGVAL